MPGEHHLEYSRQRFDHFQQAPNHVRGWSRKCDRISHRHLGADERICHASSRYPIVLRCVQQKQIVAIYNGLGVVLGSSTTPSLSVVSCCWMLLLQLTFRIWVEIRPQQSVAQSLQTHLRERREAANSEQYRRAISSVVGNRAFACAFGCRM